MPTQRLKRTNEVLSESADELDNETNTELYKTDAKRRKIIDRTICFSATKTKNFLMRNYLVDYFELFNVKSFTTKNHLKTYDQTKPVDAYTNALMESGHDYEKFVTRMIKQKIGDHKCVDLTCDVSEYASFNTFQKTIKAIKAGYPVIFQAVLHSNTTEFPFYGVADILMRSDYFNQIFASKPISNENTKVKAPNLKGDYHYRVIDVKHSTVPLDYQGMFVLDEGLFKAYKGQLFVYNQLVGQIQGLIPPATYILGKKYSWSKTTAKVKVDYTITDLFKTLGIINYANRETHIEGDVREAAKWLKQVRNEGSQWILAKKTGRFFIPSPNIPELYPNLSCQYDFYNAEKRKLAEKQKSITLLSYCGNDQLLNAYRQDIFNIDDKDLNAEVLGFNKTGKLYNVVETLIHVNREHLGVIPTKIECDLFEWRDNTTMRDFFIDFETYQNVTFSESNIEFVEPNEPRYKENSIIVTVIGIYYDGVYVSFFNKCGNTDGEKVMLQEFINFMNNLQSEPKAKRFWHWSPAEPSQYHKLTEKYPELQLPVLAFCDMLEIFRKTPIGVEGALDYSLKSIAKALYKQNKIKKVWKEQSLTDHVMLRMFQIYNETNDNKRQRHIKEMLEYNKIDCSTMKEILDYLRKNH
jgi:hypothetical protein